MRRLVLFATVGLLLATGCSSSDSASGSPAGSAATTGTASTSGGTGCGSAAECAAPAVCDPTSHTCKADLPCESHAACGIGAFCDAGTCSQNSTGGPCDSDDNCPAGETCTGGKCGCGGALYGAESVPPNVLIVLDRSSSMNEDIGGGTKWDIARQAIADVVTNFGGGVQFGLMLYPATDQSGQTGMQCGPGAVFIDPAPMTAGPITTFVNGAGTTMFGTPTAEALTILVGYAGLKDTKRSNYILLVTDGQSTCNDPVPVVASLLAENPSIKTFVVGFGSGVDPNELDAMAQAGGTALPQQPSYYQADNAASLSTAFTSIAGSVLSCSYSLSDTPPDPSLLFVYFDGSQVDKDPSHMSGWDYDPITGLLTFYGASCDQLKAGTVTDLVVAYGCPLPDVN